VLLLPEDQDALNTAQTLMTSAAEPLHSAFQVTYGQILALLGRFELHEGREFWSQTFAAYEQRSTILALQRQLEMLPDDPLEGRPCDDRLVTRHRFHALQRRLAELRLTEPPRPAAHQLRPGRVVTLADGLLAVLLRYLPPAIHAEPPWECLTSGGERRLCAPTGMASISARLLDMSEVRLSDHLVTPILSQRQLPPPTAVNALTPLGSGSLCACGSPRLASIVSGGVGRQPCSKCCVLMAGRDRRLDQIDSYHPVEPLHLSLD
jgi:hypothetical protein